MLLKKIARVLLLATALVSLKAGAASKEVLNIGISAEFENLNPIIGTQAATKYLLYMTHRPLIVLGEDYKWRALLIKEFPTVQNKLVKKKGNGLEMTIELLPNLKWGDGVDVTCEDFAFSWKVGLNKNVANSDRANFENITAINIDPKNKRKCVVEFAKMKFDYFQGLPDLLPKHLEEPIYEKFKDQSEGYDKNSLYTKAPGTPGLYFGPYMITEVLLGSHVVMLPNPHWGGKKPAFKKVIFKLIPNNATLVSNLRSGNIDMVASAAGLGPDQANAFDRQVKAENMPYNVNFEDGLIYAHVDYNLRHAALSDVRVRRALSHALNRKELIQSVLEGKAKEANQNVSDRDPWYNPKVPTYPYNKREANRLLDEAGWKMGPKGIRQKDGKNFTVTLVYSAGAKINDMIATFMQGAFKSVGVEMNTKTEPPRVFFGRTVPHAEYDLALYSWMSVPENSPRTTLHSTQIPTEKNAWAGQNSGGYSSPEMDKLIDSVELELDFKKRAEIGKKIVALYATDIPVLPIYYRPNNSVTPKNMVGYKLIGHQFYETLYVENWDLK